MKKSATHGLKLHRETLQALTTKEAAAALGGYSGYASICPTCAQSLGGHTCTC